MTMLKIAKKNFLDTWIPISPDRHFGLDVLRAVAILAVMLAHSLAFFPDLPRYYRQFPAYFLGYQGVELFFILSGYLIGGILLRSFLEKNHWTFGDLWYFWRRRWWRTLPSYYLFLLIYFVANWVAHKPNMVDWRYLFFLQNWTSPMPDFYDVTWSLCIEEWFYVLLPLWIFVADKVVVFLGKKTVAREHTFWLATFSFWFLGLILRGGLILSDLPQWDEGVRKVVVLRLDAIPLGVLAAWLHYYCVDFWQKNYKVLLGIGILFLGIGIGLLFQMQLVQQSYFMNSWLMFMFTNLGFMFCLPFFTQNFWLNTEGGGIFRCTLQRISIISYSLYLFHSLGILIVNKLYVKWGISPYLNFVAFWFFSFGICGVFYRFFEKKMTDMRVSKKA